MNIRDLTENAIKEYTKSLLDPKNKNNSSLYNIIFSAIQDGMSDAYGRGIIAGRELIYSNPLV